MVNLNSYIKSKEAVRHHFLKLYENIRPKLNISRYFRAVEIPLGDQLYRLNEDFQVLLKYLIEFIIRKHLEGMSCRDLIKENNIAFTNGDLRKPYLIDSSTCTPLPDTCSTDYSNARTEDYIQVRKLVHRILMIGDVLTRASVEVKSFYEVLEYGSECEILNHWILWSTHRREIFMCTFHKRLKGSPKEFTTVLGELHALKIEISDYLPVGDSLYKVYNYRKAHYDSKDAASLPHFFRNCYQHAHEYSVGGALGIEALDAKLYSSFPTFLTRLCEILDDRLPSFWG